MLPRKLETVVNRLIFHEDEKQGIISFEAGRLLSSLYVLFLAG